MPTTATASARTREARPSVSTSGRPGLGAELRRALRDQRVALGNEAVAFALDRHDHLATRAEGVGHDPLVANRHGDATSALPDAEVENAALPAVSRRDLAGQLIGAPVGGYADHRGGRG